ncbi:MAG: leucine-rich repeat domain-containing protein [Tannerella sp.]|jgi:hypothetical protein|nr:leucine-rich repeat domain-containing protein [Tannerella sp.]
MKKIALKSLIYTAVIGMCMATSCNDDGKTELKSVDVTNAELKAVLLQKGFVFNAEGLLLVDEKVTAVTTLDLSGCDLSDASGLDVFPNLTEVNLANNKFGFVFDFSVLPASITGVDLTGNEIYEYPGLVSVEVQENGDETVTTLHKLTKLYLPESARHNCDEIVYFYTENKTADVKIQNAQGTLAAYNTLREVPDERLRTYFQENFPSLFDKDNRDMINIANRIFRADEASRGIAFDQIPNATTTVENVEGVQYIVMHPSWKGTAIGITSKTLCELPYLKVKPNVSGLGLVRVTIGYFNLAEAKSITTLNLDEVPIIEHIDLSASTLFGQRGVVVESNIGGSTILVNNCPELKTIVLPQKAKCGFFIRYTNLPLLEEINLSHFSWIGTLGLGNLPGLKKLDYFIPDDGSYSSTSGSLYFVISAEIYAFPETKAFLDAYHEYCKQFSFGVTPRITAYRWTQHYQ